VTSATAYTNVQLLYCSQDGTSFSDGSAATSTNPSGQYEWSFKSNPGFKVGPAFVGFFADPNQTLYAVVPFTVAP
jgi:hypothetical protein